MARFEFTMVSDAMLQGLAEAGATGSEMRAYIMLVRGLPKDRSNAECWMPADMAEAKNVMSPAMFTKSLATLSKKEFTTVDGEPRTVLTKITRGCRGHCPHFEDTLGLAIANGEYPPTIARQKRTPIEEPNGTPNGRPIEEPNGTPKQTPIDEFSTLEWNTKTNQLEHQNEPIGIPHGAPIETIQDKQIVADALLPAAELSIGVSQPHKRETRERLQVATGTEPARANGAAPRGRAIALPSWQEVLAGASTEPEPAPEPVHVPEPTPADEARYFELLRKVQDHMATGGAYDEALTPQERSEFNEISARRRAHAIA